MKAGVGGISNRNAGQKLSSAKKLSALHGIRFGIAFDKDL
jgi:hypothetical protein